MLDSKKIGSFITKERKNKKLTQDEMADMLYISRSAISKWERGLSLPDYDSMINLCGFFNITANELLAGERLKKENEKEINELPIRVLKEEKKKTRRLFLFLFTFIIILIILFLVFYFLNTYKKFEIYTIGAKNSNFIINNTIMTVTTDEAFIKLGEIATSKEIKNIELYYIKDENRKHILSSDSFDEIIIQNKNNDEYFELNDFDIIKDNLYVDISYLEDEEVKVDTIKLEFLQRYINDKVLFHHKNEEYTDIIKEEDNFESALSEKLINQGFKVENDIYINKSKKDNITIKVDFKSSSITIEDLKKEETFMMLYEVNLYSFMKGKNNEVIEDSSFYDNEVTCNIGDCSNHKETYNYYIEKYIRPLIGDFRD